MKYLLPLILIAISSCRYGVSYSELLDLEKKKEAVIEIAEKDLTLSNQRILKDYFNSIKELVYDLKNDTGMRNYFHRKYFRYFRPEMCEKLILPNSEYIEVLNKCNVSGFYICSEEVKYYKEMLLEVKKLYTDMEIQSLEREKKCWNLIKELGVINE